ncbi:MAG: SRPBCC domain-containing protein [Bacteroidia bacterium]
MSSTNHNIHITKNISASREAVFNLFRDNTVFKLTGANEIESDFKVGGKFSLLFKNRGTISGRFIKLTESEIILEWDVEGFNLPKETNTILKISLMQEEQMCLIELIHSNINNADSAAAKKRAWTEILDDIEKAIGNK